MDKYALEPQPTAKLVLNTTAGDIELELFAKQTPLASRNFLQHCLDGYYDNTIFHRLVPGFVVQGGDPTGTGAGGASSFEDGRPFEDEFHSRLRFNRRGLLGMANSGAKNDNASQFFLTLGDTPELQGKNTMFGRVVGDTIYNLMKMGDAELAEEAGDRPLYPYKITKTEILVNPFEDMVRRDLTRRAVVAQQPKQDKKKVKRKAGKTMLSFGGDDEDEDGVGLAPVAKKPKFNPKLFNAAPPPKDKRLGPELLVAKPLETEAADARPSERKPAAETMRAQKPPRVLSPSPPPKRDQILSSLASRPSKRPQSESESDSESGNESESITDKRDAVSRMNAQIDELKASMRRSGPSKAMAADTKKKSVLESLIPENAIRGRKRGTREDPNVLKLFNAFKSKLEAAPPELDSPVSQKGVDAGVEDSKRGSGNGHVAAGEDEEADLCDLHFVAKCQSCSKWHEAERREEEEIFSNSNWMSHKLSFEKDRLGKDLEWKKKNEEMLVIDPREREKDLGIKRRGRHEDGIGNEQRYEEKNRRR